MIDRAQPRAAILILRRPTMILDRKSANLAPAGPNIRERIEVFVIHDVAGIVADLETFVADFVHNTRATLSRCRVPPVLLDYYRDAVAPRHRRHFLQIADK